MSFIPTQTHKSTVNLVFDTNASSTSTPIDASNTRYVSFFALANTGAHSNHILTLQISPDNINWEDTNTTLSGVGKVDATLCVTNWIRLKVTTVESAPSTINLTVIVN